MKPNVYIYILVMAGVTYLIRMLPLVLVKKEITSPYVKSFLYYVPYACLAAMTFPAILTATAGGIISGAAGLIRGADRSLSRKEPSYGCIVCVCSSVCGREDYGIFDVNNMKCLPALLLAEPGFLRYKKLLRNVYVRKNGLLFRK